MGMKSVEPSEAMIAARKDVLVALQPHKEKLTSVEILAILSYSVGQAIALQDQNEVTPAIALQIVQTNIEQGNQDAIMEILGNTAGEA